VLPLFIFVHQMRKSIGRPDDDDATDRARTDATQASKADS